MYLPKEELGRFGAIACWGHNLYGQLGHGSITSSNTPMAVTGINDATTFTTGAYHTCAALTGGTATC